jgi:predicted alpha-1,2-mannosidase
MTFQYALSSKLSVQNVYGLIADFDLVRQLVRIDLEHLTSPTDATVQIDDRRPEKIKLQFGYNSLLVTAPVVDIDKPTVVTLNYSDGSTVQTEFQLRPVQPFKYMPADLERESVSKTLEYAYDDWCIAQLADELNEEDDVSTFSERATFYRNVYDPSTGFMRGRLADGSWKEPFSPRFTSHRQDDYTEGNAWQYSWFVPHDVRGLIELMGGREAFIAKLDELFSQSSTLEGSAPPDVSGLIGQYAHGNEPSHHIAYLYAYAGAPWKTQERVRLIIDSLYNATPEGLSGNEDCGQLSAWYIFSAIGLYPVNPADGTYVIGTPRFERVTIQLEGGRQFTVEAPGVSETNMYIQTARLNGRPLDRCYITHDEIANGGTLVFIMGATPNRSWAASEAAAPPSMTR